MNRYCKCGGRITATARKICCATNKAIIVHCCVLCNTAYEQPIRMAKRFLPIDPTLVGSKGYLYFSLHSIIAMGERYAENRQFQKLMSEVSNG